VGDDWLSSLEQKQKIRTQASAAEAAEEVRKKHAEDQQRQRRVEFYEAHKDQVESIYSQLLIYMDRAARVGLQTTIKRSGAWLHIVWGPHRSLGLTPEAGGITAHYFDLYDNRGVNLDKHYRFEELTESRLSSWAKWLTTGEGKPWSGWSSFFT
jgi:hypothetical protein